MDNRSDDIFIKMACKEYNENRLNISHVKHRITDMWFVSQTEHAVQIKCIVNVSVSKICSLVY